MKPSKHIENVIDQIKLLALAGRVIFTAKALYELESMDIGLDSTDVCLLLTTLEKNDFHDRILSKITDEYLYVFIVRISNIEVYLKIMIRQSCVIISFHENRSKGANYE